MCTMIWAWEEHLGVVAESQCGDLLGVAEPVLLGAGVQVLHYYQAAAGVGKEACSREGAPELVCYGPAILPAASGLGLGGVYGPYLCLASRSRWPAHSRCSPQQSSGAATRFPQWARKHSVRKWSRMLTYGTAPSYPTYHPPPQVVSHQAGAWDEAMGGTWLGWDKWQEHKNLHRRGQLGIEAGGADGEAGVGDVGGPWSQGGHTGIARPRALKDRTHKEVGQSSGGSGLRTLSVCVRVKAQERSKMVPVKWLLSRPGLPSTSAAAPGRPGGTHVLGRRNTPRNHRMAPHP